MEVSQYLGIWQMGIKAKVGPHIAALTPAARVLLKPAAKPPELCISVRTKPGHLEEGSGM